MSDKQNTQDGSGAGLSTSLSKALFAVIVEDRHCDVQVEVWDDEAAAVDRAKAIAREYCRYDDYAEEQIADWVFYARYSCEDDSVRVVRVELHTANAALHLPTEAQRKEVR
jgi:hypothetical protein